MSADILLLERLLILHWTWICALRTCLPLLTPPRVEWKVYLECIDLAVSQTEGGERASMGIRILVCFCFLVQSVVLHMDPFLSLFNALCLLSMQLSLDTSNLSIKHLSLPLRQLSRSHLSEKGVCWVTNTLGQINATCSSSLRGRSFHSERQHPGRTEALLMTGSEEC